MARAKAWTSVAAGASPRPLTLLAVAATLVVIVACAGWAWARFQPASATSPFAVTAGHVQSIVRRTEIVVADTAAVWRRALPAEGRRSYSDTDVVFFSRATGTPCAGSGTVSGSFYCPETGTASFDLAFMDVLGERLQNERDLGLALYAARVSAEHLQRQLGYLDAASLELIGSRRADRVAVRARLALQADCMTGVWAAAAEPRIGPVPDRLYRQMVWSSRNIVADLARQGVRVPLQFDPLGAASEEDRGAAFAKGYAAGKLAACTEPGAG